MPRQIANTAEFLEGYRLFSEGVSHRNIHESLSESDHPPSMRTVGNWISRYKAVSPKLQDESQTVYWHELVEKGFNWGAGRALKAYYRVNRRYPNKRALKWVYRLSLVGGWEDEELVQEAGYYEESELRELFDLERIEMRSIDNGMLERRIR